MRASGPAIPTALAALAALGGVAAFGTGCAESGGDAAGQLDGGDVVHVAVAANFATVQERLAAEFERATGAAVVASVGSTGQLYAQIRNGAPFDVLLAADTARPARLAADGVAAAGSRFTYARGRLALFAPGAGVGAGEASRRDAESPAPADVAVSGSGDADGEPSGPGSGARAPAADAAGTIARLVSTRSPALIAIANPATAPYGAAAIQALDRLGLRDRVDGRLVRGENVGQAHAFVASGAAELGFVALSQVVREPAAAYVLVPDSLHSPIRQDAVLLARAGERAAPRRYLEFLRSDAARRIIESFGYEAEP